MTDQERRDKIHFADKRTGEVLEELLKELMERGVPPAFFLLLLRGYSTAFGQAKDVFLGNMPEEVYEQLWQGLEPLFKDRGVRASLVPGTTVAAPKESQ